YSSASQSHLSSNSHRADHIRITAYPQPVASSEKTTMNSAAKKFRLSFLFLCWASLAAALPATPDRSGNALAVRTLRGYLMIVEVCINERGPFDFLVDTGSNTTLLDPELAAELG